MPYPEKMRWTPLMTTKGSPFSRKKISITTSNNTALSNKIDFSSSSNPMVTKALTTMNNKTGESWLSQTNKEDWVFEHNPLLQKLTLHSGGCPAPTSHPCPWISCRRTQRILPNPPFVAKRLLVAGNAYIPQEICLWMCSVSICQS